MYESKGHGNGSNDPANSRSRDVDRRRFLKATGGTAAGVAFAGCLETAGSVVGGSDDEDPVKIGLLTPDQSGDMIGRSMYRSAAIAVEELNDAGGIDDRDVELVVGNTNSSPLEARREYQRLILEEDVDVTTGVFASEALLGIIDDIAEQQRLHLTSGAATTDVSRKVSEQYEDYKYHFRVGPNNDVDLGRMQIDFLTEMSDEIGWERIALLAEDYEWTEQPWEVYQSRLEETGVETVLKERYPPSIDDFSGRYDEVEDNDADAVFITTAHTGTGALMDWSYPNRNAPDPDDRTPPQPRPFEFGGIHVPMQLPAYYGLVGGQCEYGIGQTSATPTSTITDKTQDFVQTYQNKHEGTNPVYTGYHTYDAVKLFAHAVEEAGTFDHDELVSTLEETTFTGSAGTVQFYEQDETVEGVPVTHDLVYEKSETIYFQWQADEDGGGTQEVIWPPEQETASYQEPDWL